MYVVLAKSVHNISSKTTSSITTFGWIWHLGEYDSLSNMTFIPEIIKEVRRFVDYFSNGMCFPSSFISIAIELTSHLISNVTDKPFTTTIGRKTRP